MQGEAIAAKRCAAVVMASQDPRKTQTLAELERALVRVLDAVNGLPTEVSDASPPFQVWYAASHSRLAGCCVELARLAELARRTL